MARRNQKPVRLHTSGSNANIHLKISDITNAMAANLPPVLADLLEGATYVYSADQTVSRGGKRSFDYGRRLRRNMQFVIPLRLPELWGRADVLEALVPMLCFLSDDNYEFVFLKSVRPADPAMYFEFDANSPNVTGIEEVCLFSGGLDSLAGPFKR